MDIDKIKLALLFYKKQNIGIELPMIPDKKQEKDDEPDPNKIKAEEASLIPEQLWLSMNTVK